VQLQDICEIDSSNEVTVTFGAKFSFFHGRCATLLVDSWLVELCECVFWLYTYCSQWRN